MNIDRILLIIIIIYLIFLHCKKNKNIEKFAVTDDIRSAVKEIYNTDMEAVRQLDKMAKDLTTGALRVPGNLIVDGTITVSGNIIGNHIYTKTLDIKGKYGTTHFNHGDSGTTYLRDNVYVHDYLETNKFKASGTSQLGHIYTNTLDIKGKNGTTHFNNENSGTTYLRDDVNIAGHLTGTNFTMNTGKDTLNKIDWSISTNPNSGQFKTQNGVHFGAGAYHGISDRFGPS